MSNPIHIFTQSQAFRFSPLNVNGMGNPSSNNPYLLRENLNIALGTMSPAYFSQPMGPGPCAPDDLIAGCGGNGIPFLYLTFPPSTYPICVSNIMAGWVTTFKTDINAEPDFPSKFLELLELVENSVQTYGVYCTTEAYELHVIFDGVTDVNWGAFINVGGNNRRHVPWPLAFPNSFKNFEVIIYAPSTKTHYQTNPQLLFSA